jgi:hypothetical protein
MQYYLAHVSQRYGEAESICLKVDAGVGFFSGVQYIISVKESEGIMLGSAHASTTYGTWRIKFGTQAIATDNTYRAKKVYIHIYEKDH